MEIALRQRSGALSWEKAAYSVGSAFRQALIEIGNSPDMHIYDLDKFFLDRPEEDESAFFLKKVAFFYNSLPSFEKRIFLCECLEKGRHYHFWWMDYAPRKNYSRRMNALFSKIERYFFC